MSLPFMSVGRLLVHRSWSSCQSSTLFSVALGHNMHRHSCVFPQSSRIHNFPLIRSSFSTESQKDNHDKEDNQDKEDTKTEQKQEELLQNQEESKGDKVESKEDLLKKEVASLEEKLKLKDKELTKAKNDVLRTLADMENLRARSQRDNKQVRDFATQSFAKSLLDVSDNLQLAVKNAQNDVDNEPDNKPLSVLFEGIGLTEKTLTKAFKKHHILQFDSLDTVFDPHKHEGLFQFPDPTRTPGTVGNVLKEGFMIRDRVLRPAQVGTVMAPPEEKKEEDSPEESPTEPKATEPKATDESTTEETPTKKNSA